MDVNASALWSWKALCEALGVPVSKGPDVTRVVTDSRQVAEGDLFVALAGDPGERFNPSQRSSIDGHDYVAQALAAGAVGALVRVGYTTPDASLLTAQDTYDGLWALGRAGRDRLSGPVIAVTGSSGKTTAKTFLMAATQGYGSPRSFNNHIGVPLTLANAPPGAPLYVIEIGTNHPGEIAPLADMARPDLAIVLNVQSAHIENFASKADLTQEKVSIFKGLNSNGIAICHEDVPIDGTVRFGTGASVEGRLLAVRDDLATFEIDGRRLSGRVPGGGEHRALTLTACALALSRLSLPLEPLLELPDEVIPAGRGRMQRIGPITLLDDAYNANPGSMNAALTAFLARSDASLVILGEMLELGSAGPGAHQALVARLEENPGVSALWVGEGFRACAPEGAGTWFPAADEALAAAAVSHLRTHPGSVLIKGSNRVFWQSEFVSRLADHLD